MPEPEGFKLYSLRVRDTEVARTIQASADALVELAQDHATACDHPGATYLCARHPDRVLCFDCMDAHQREHSPLESECSWCAVLRPTEARYVLAGRAPLYRVVVRLCSDCCDS